MDEDMDLVYLPNLGQIEDVIEVMKTCLEDEKFTDVTIICNGGRLQCHRAILSAASPFFANIFQNFSDDNAILILPDYEFRIVRCLVYLIYTGNVEIDVETLERMVDIGNDLQISAVANSKSCPVTAKTIDRSKPPKVQNKNDTIATGTRCVFSNAKLKRKPMSGSFTEDETTVNDPSPSKTPRQTFRPKHGPPKTTNVGKPLLHVRTSGSKNPKCELVFNHRASIKKHLFKCTQRTKVFGDPIKLVNHQESSHVVGNNSNNIHTKNSKFIILNTNGRKYYRCQRCNLKTSTQSKMTGHWNRVHKEEPSVVLKQETKSKLYRCDVCNTSYPYSYNLKRHFKTSKHISKMLKSKRKKGVLSKTSAQSKKTGHWNRVHKEETSVVLKKETKTKLYRCDVCNSSYPNSSHLSRHYMTYKHNKNLIKSKRQKQIHKLIEDSDDKENVLYKINPFTTPVKMTKCTPTIGSAKFKGTVLSKRELKDRIPSEHSIIDYTANLCCTYCGIQCRNRRSYRYHVLKHMECYKCCDKVFGERCKYIAHVLDDHDGRYNK